MKSVKFCYTYDQTFDLLDFSCEGEFKFKRSIKLDEAIFLDFDQNDTPVALELIGASKIFGVDRKHLMNPDFCFQIKITDRSIKTEIKLKRCDVSVKSEIPNEGILASSELIITN